DGALSAALPAFNIEVLDVNDAPTISGSPVTSVGEGKAYSFTPIASDVDGDTLTFSITNKPSWATFNTSSGTLSGIPSASDIGITSGISISVSDGALSAALPAFNIEVLDVNDAPTISGSPVTSVGEGKAYSFTPIASDVDGDTLTFSITNKPSWATFNTSSGTLSGIPSASDIGITSGIIISVSDGALSAALPAFNIEVLNVNEAPVLEGQNVSVDEDSSLTISLNAQDADNDELTFEVISEPLFGQVSMVGSSVVYTPNADYFGQDQFSVIANDGELASEPAVVIVDIKSVNDAPIAADDAFTQTYSDTMLYTLDVLANDSDVDGDVLRVMAVSADIGSVTIVDNQLVYQAIMGGPEQVNLSYTLVDQGEEIAKANVVLTITDQITDQLPIINVPDTVSVNATGLYTKVNIGIATAEDTDGNPLAVSLVNNRVVFEPGKHTVYWYAEDSEGRSRVAAQQVNVNPLISIDKDTTIAEGGGYTTELYLNGDAVSYPLTVEYTVSGSADGNDHDLLAGEVTFNYRHASIHFTSFEDGDAEGDETLVISLVGEHNFAENKVQTITISEANIAPTVELVTMQGEQMQAIVSKQNGEVLIKADVTDANSLDVVTLSWQSELINTSSEEHIFSFDPAVLSVGIYKISAIATDNGATPRSTMRSAYIEVREELTQLDEQIDSDGDLIPDTQEGYKDADLDGIPDYLDAIADCNVIQQRVDQQAHFLIEGEAGICIRKGSTVSNNQSGGVLLFSHELVTDDDAIHQGGIVDFIVEGLKELGQSYQLVFPQHEAVPENAIYRKLINGQWQDFVIDDNNQIHSTSGEFGFCPAPGDGSWTPGLTAGHWCVQVTIEDGGQNDADGQVNGTIVDPSGVAVMNTQNNRPQAQSDSVAMPWNSTLVIDVLANDSDADGDTLTINSVTTDFGSVIIADNQLHYTAPIDFYGVAVIRYSISDGQGGSANSTVTVTVNANFAPSAMDDSAETDDATAINIAVLVNDSDPDGDALTVTSANVDSGSVVINADNTLTFTPQTGSATTATIDYAISDGRYTASAKVTVTVTKAQTPPPPEPNKPGSKKSSGAFTFALLLLLISAAIMRRRFKY
ncbi:Ig-like domain-containing protein, partial [Pseudoalteromonas spongiae]|uniref:Ig-like domain-containing protein n=1 Tax=Pseudoalteromonas spongiae TaxID=298657 RepID=UPI00110BC128